MERNKELILKYLSDTLSDNEKKIFEKKLHNDLLFKETLDSFNEKINIKKEILDEGYFINLIPRVKQKINNKRKIPVIKFAYGLSVIFISLVIIFFINKINTTNHSIYNENVNLLGDSISVNLYNDDVDELSKLNYYESLINQPLTSSIEFNDKEIITKIYDTIFDNGYYELNIMDEDYNKLFAAINY